MPTRSRVVSSHARIARPLWAIMVAALLWAATASAEPYRPDHDETVLERLPAASELAALTPLRKRVAARPDDLAAATRLARRYIELSRAHADPRFLGYAEAVLAPWADGSAPPPEVLVLLATTAQSRHDFEHALDLLERALKRDPDNAQAWLTRATVLQVKGRFEPASAACRQLVRSAGRLIALTCLTSVNSLNGRLAESYRQLLALSRTRSPDSPDLSAWVQTLLGEMAIRLGDQDAAEAHFRRGLAVKPNDVYLQAAYADLLLALERPREVIDLLEDNVAQDILLLRLALAGQRLELPEAERWAAEFDARYDAARRGGDATHLREQARFVLEVAGRPDEALELARRNWRVQHEPDDVLILLRAALAADRPQAAAPVLDWIKATGFQDQRIVPLLARLNDADGVSL